MLVPPSGAVRNLSPPAHDLSTPELLGREIAQRLEADIVTLRIPPETRLIEDDISRRFGVSRSPIREAMRLLEADGLVLRLPRRGSMVAPMSAGDFDAICVCRAPLEALASAGAARHADAEAMAALRTALTQMADAEQRGDALAAFTANVAITDTLHAHCGNPVLRRLLSVVDKLALRYRYCAYRGASGFMETAVAANRALIAAIDLRNDAEASRITEDLIRQSRLDTLAMLQKGILEITPLG
ncbi:MAG TPA: GntR family transcriptional regulator [Stellaceae bacterium]|nr:GntR family transcriptional regulator [Stellaceae bacterium]